jgi:hypothetical protein
MLQVIQGSAAVNRLVGLLKSRYGLELRIRSMQAVSSGNLLDQGMQVLRGDLHIPITSNDHYFATAQIVGGEKLAAKDQKNINDLVNEIVKVKMTIENQISYNKDVAESIPELSGLIAFEIITDTYLNTNTAPQLDMDEILDKISISGFNSLTDEEKDFLDKKSKDV